MPFDRDGNEFKCMVQGGSAVTPLRLAAPLPQRPTAALPRKPNMLTISRDARTAPPARAVVTRQEVWDLLGQRHTQHIKAGLTARQALQRLEDEFPDLYRVWAE
jgi:hypothetical protein